MTPRDTSDGTNRQKTLPGAEPPAAGQVLRLSEFEPGQTGDCFALLAAKDKSSTRDGKPYYRVTFRDADRAVTAMVWSDSGWFADCDTKWEPGRYYKLRGRYSETQYGPQLELDRVREVAEADRADGFDEGNFSPRTRFDVDDMFAELTGIANQHISDVPLRQLVVGLLEDHAAQIKRTQAASRHHHAYLGGFLEHVLSVTRTALFLAEKYIAYYPNMNPPLSKSLVVAGAILHDIGKLRELDPRPQGAEYTPAGRLIGHIVMGRDMVRERAATLPDFDSEILLRLEHLILSHQNLPEWGSPVAPHTPEALLVYYADDIDAKFQMMAQVLEEKNAAGELFSGRDNPLRRNIYRGPGMT